MQEIWKNIVGLEGRYMVSNLGRVKSLAHGQERILKGQISDRGYHTVMLRVDGHNKMYKVHRLVAIAFLDNPNHLPEVNHKDENRLNNVVDNLEWCTHHYNVCYGHRAQHFVETLKSNPNRNMGGLSRRAVDRIDADGNIVHYENITIASHDVNGCTGAICACAKGKKKTYKGYVWRYSDSQITNND